MGVILAGCLLPASKGVAAEPKPPQPNPAEPVNYLQWINQTMGAGLKSNAADAYREAFAKLTRFEGEWGGATDGPWSDNKPVSDWLAANAEALAKFRKAAEMQECFLRLDDPPSTGDARADHLLMGVLLPSLQSYRDAARGLVAEGYRAWAQGDRKVLPANAILVVRAAHHVETGPPLLNHLVATAILAMGYEALQRSLSLSDKPDPLAASVLADLGKADGPRLPITHAYLVERLIMWDLCQRLFVPGEQAEKWTLHEPILSRIGEFGERKLTPAQLKKVTQAGPASALAGINRYFDALDKWAARPYHLAAADTDRIEKMAAAATNPLVQMLLPSLSRSRVLTERVVASRRATPLIAGILVHHGGTG